MQYNDLGNATITATGQTIAGACGTWRLKYTAGRQGVAVGGGVRVYTDSDTDWGTPQFDDPAGQEYMSIESPAGVLVAARTIGVRTVQAALHSRALRAGESITFVFGDTSGGGPGSRCQTFCETKRYFWVDVDPAGGREWTSLTDSPHLAVVADETVRLVGVAPSTVLAGQEFDLIIKAEDRWGNPVPGYAGRVEIEAAGLRSPAASAEFPPGEHRGALRVGGLKATRIGVIRIALHDRAAGLSAFANPIAVTERNSGRQLYWADPHGGQLVLASKIADFFRYARDVSGVQFVGYQRNADAMSEEDYRIQQQQEKEFYEPGRFVPIPGFEWSGRTWEGGHHNVYFRRHDQPARRNLPVEDVFRGERAAAELPHIRDVYAAFRGTDTMITPHVGGEHSDLSLHDPTLEPAVEITSSHGSFEWMLEDSLARGYRMGFLGGSDCYTGRPGDDRPGHQLRRYAKSGLTGIYADDVSLESFFSAMRARRVYATTGARIVVSFDGDGNAMGSEYTTSRPPLLSVAVAGTAPLESVELFRGLKPFYSHRLSCETADRQVRVLFGGSSRQTSYSGVVWDGTLRVRGGSIPNVETIRFDSPRSHVVEHTAETVRWHAWGCGYPMGLTVDLDGDDPVLEIALKTQTISGPGFGGHGEKGPRRISFAPAEAAVLAVSRRELNDGPVELEIGVLDRKLTVALAPQTRQTTADFRITDPSPRQGVNPYWLRVVQTDMEMAWTSPVFVDVVQQQSAG